jgi:uncharacterized protein
LIGPDLQTLRDTLRTPKLPLDLGEPLAIGVGGESWLLALVDPPVAGAARALVLLLHGLGGSSEREGLRRMGLSLQASGLDGCDT